MNQSIQRLVVDALATRKSLLGTALSRLEWRSTKLFHPPLAAWPGPLEQWRALASCAFRRKLVRRKAFSAAAAAGSA